MVFKGVFLYIEYLKDVLRALAFDVEFVDVTLGGGQLAELGFKVAVILLGFCDLVNRGSGNGNRGSNFLLFKLLYHKIEGYKEELCYYIRNGKKFKIYLYKLFKEPYPYITSRRNQKYHSVGGALKLLCNSGIYDNSYHSGKMRHKIDKIYDVEASVFLVENGDAVYRFKGH